MKHGGQVLPRYPGHDPMRTLSAITALFLGTAPLADDSEGTGITSYRDLVAAAKAEVTAILPRELAAREVVLVDVREPFEYRDGHIPGAANIPRGRLEFYILDHPVLKDIAWDDPGQVAEIEIVLYCGNGGRSALAAQTLQSMGFNNVSFLAGGYSAWTEGERPVQK